MGVGVMGGPVREMPREEIIEALWWHIDYHQQRLDELRRDLEALTDVSGERSETERLPDSPV